MLRQKEFMRLLRPARAPWGAQGTGPSSLAWPWQAQELQGEEGFPIHD